MEAAATHTSLCGPARGTISPGRVLGLAHGMAIQMARAPEGGTGWWQLWTVARVRPKGQLALAVSIIVLPGEGHGQM